MGLERKVSATYNPTMRVGIVQLNSHVGAVERNVEAILSYVSKARQEHCDLVIFPELAVCGYFPFDLLWRAGFVEKVASGLDEIVHHSKGIGILTGGITALPARESTNLIDPSSLIDGAASDRFNSAFLIADGRLVGRQDKLHLPTFDVYNEKRTFTAGEGSQVFEFHNERLGINICEDLWVGDGPIQTQASLGASVIVNISASPFFAGKGAIRRRLAYHRAKENEVMLIYANRIGGQDELVFDGGSLIAGPEGDLLFQAPYFTEGLFVADLDDLSPIPAPSDDPIDLVRQAIGLGIRDYVGKNGFAKALVGLSGGVDSAVVAALAVEALGPEAVTGVFLPSAITGQESRADAHDVAQRLSIELVEVPIEEVAMACRNALPNKPTGLVDENLQARARGILLMALANERHALVLATGNKSEIAVGYNTLYGDTIGAIAPIADLYKSEVYRLAERFRERIPKRVFEKAPTAELRPNQRDEDDLPPYEILDPILHRVIEENFPREALIDAGFSEAVVDDILSRYYRSEYKRAQLPPVIKVSPKAFGIGRQMPITHNYHNQTKAS